MDCRSSAVVSLLDVAADAQLGHSSGPRCGQCRPIVEIEVSEQASLGTDSCTVSLIVRSNPTRKASLPASAIGFCPSLWDAGENRPHFKVQVGRALE
jgi:hypothetical protein